MTIEFLLKQNGEFFKRFHTFGDIDDAEMIGIAFTGDKKERYPYVFLECDGIIVSSCDMKDIKNYRRCNTEYYKIEEDVNIATMTEKVKSLEEFFNVRKPEDISFAEWEWTLKNMKVGYMMKTGMSML